MHRTIPIALALFLALTCTEAAHAQVLSYQRIGQGEGGFTGILDPNDQFGASMTALGDIDGDGICDLAVGAFLDDDGNPITDPNDCDYYDHNSGAIWVLFLEADGNVRVHQKISETEGGFTGGLGPDAEFGGRITGVGDLDGDGVPDLATMSGLSSGFLWILFLNPDGTVKAHHRTTLGVTGFLTCPGDVDGDGVVDLALGDAFDDDGGDEAGAVWILFLNDDGTLRDQQKISSLEGGFVGGLSDYDRFGVSVAGIEDLDEDGTPDLAVGASGDDDSFRQAGAVWILFLNPDGTVRAQQKISALEGGFTGALGDQALFGVAMAAPGDVDGDGVEDLAVADHMGLAPVWMLLLNDDGSVKSHFKMGERWGGVPLGSPQFYSIAALGVQEPDSAGALVVGEHEFDSERGSVMIVNHSPTVPATDRGWYNETGFHDPTNLNYAVGDDEFVFGNSNADDLGDAVLVLETCPGKVNLGVARGPTDVLFVNGNAGPVSVAVGSPVTLSLNAAPRGGTRYALYAWLDAVPNAVSLEEAGLGCISNPIPIMPPSNPQPFRCLLGSGMPPVLCQGVTRGPSPPTVPFSLTLSSGVGIPITATLQAIIEDNGSRSATGFSVGNGVVLTVE